MSDFFPLAYGLIFILRATFQHSLEDKNILCQGHNLSQSIIGEIWDNLKLLKYFLLEIHIHSSSRE